MSGFYIGNNMTPMMGRDAGTGWRDSIDGSYLNAGTMTAQLFDADGNAMGTAVTMSYVAASDGQYKGTIAHDNGPDDMVCGTLYTLKIIASEGVYYDLRVITERAQHRTYT